IDRERAADLGVSVSDIANTLHLLVGGLKVSDFYQNGEQYEVHVRALLPYRNDASVISQLTVPSSLPNTPPIPLEQVVSFAKGTARSFITRLNRQRNVLLTCNVLPGYSQQTVQTKLAQIVANLKMGPEYTSGPSGTSREQVRAFGAFLTAFLLSIIFMYLIL